MIKKRTYDNQQKILVDLLTEISNHYLTISLEQLSNRYGYTKQYLSSLIKKISGQIFIELRTRKRLEQAKYLLTSSDYRKKNYLDDHFLWSLAKIKIYS